MPATSGESSKNTLCRIVGPSHPWALGSGAPDRIIPEKYGFVVSHPRQLHYPGLSAGMFLQDVARHGCRAQAPRDGTVRRIGTGVPVEIYRWLCHAGIHH